MSQSSGSLLSVDAVSAIADRASHMAASGAAGHPRHSTQDDPIVELVRAWIAEKEVQDSLQCEWQDAENDLCRKIRPLRMSLRQAERAGFAEAKRMRALMKRIRAADRRLYRASGKIVTMRATTAHGALAKIEMALRLLEPLDCEEYSWALLQAGFEQLRDLIGIGGPLGCESAAR